MLLDQIGWCGNPNLTKTHDDRRPVAFGDVGRLFKSSKSSDQKIPRTPSGGTRAFNKLPPFDANTFYYYSTYGDPRLRGYWLTVRKAF
jgi:hypothetical protein